MVSQVGELQDARHRAERVAPAVDLGEPGLVAKLLEEPITQQIREARLHSVGDELLARALVEMHPQVTLNELEVTLAVALRAMD